jgi:hypothetical protein
MLRDLKHYSLRIGRFERLEPFDVSGQAPRSDGTSGTLELASLLE